MPELVRKDLYSGLDLLMALANHLVSAWEISSNFTVTHSVMSTYECISTDPYCDT